MTETKRKLDLCYGIITEYLVDKGFKKKGLLYTKKDAQFCITFKIDKVGNHRPGVFHLESGITFMGMELPDFPEKKRNTPINSDISFGMEKYGWQSGIDVDKESDESALSKTRALLKVVDEEVMEDMKLCMDISYMKTHYHPNNPFFYKFYMLPSTQKSLYKWLLEQ
jgi:hypothetical protein